MERLRSTWNSIQSSLWYRPALWVVGLAGLAFALVLFDRVVTVGQSIPESLRWFLLSGATGARTMLGAIATASFTATTIAFSIIMVAVIQTANAYSPRLLRLYFRNEGNQHVLGILSGTYVYSLIVLRAVDNTGSEAFVPTVATNGALLLALIATGSFIYFINHAAQSITVSSIIADVLAEAESLIDGERIFPETVGHAWPSAAAPPMPDVPSAIYSTDQGGYINSIQADKLLNALSEADAMIRLEHSVGGYVLPGMRLGVVFPSGALDDNLNRSLHAAIRIGERRTLAFDLFFAIRQLADIAVRALSPGINDPTTAWHCIGALSLLLTRISHHGPISPYRCDEEGHLRVVVGAPTFAEALQTAFSQIRHYAAGDTDTLIHLLRAYQALGQILTRTEEKEALWRQVRYLMETASETVETAGDRARLNRVYSTLAENFDDGVEKYRLETAWEDDDVVH